jgi:hypothetical protein
MKINKKQLDELVGGDITSSGNQRNVTSNSEIETGPVDKPYNDDSDYEKGASTTTDRVFGRYRQNIPWFAVYSFGGSRTGGISVNNGVYEDDNKIKNKIITKRSVEEKIDDLVKKSDVFDVINKSEDPAKRLKELIKKLQLSKTDIETLRTSLDDKEEQTKNI